MAAPAAVMTARNRTRRRWRLLWALTVLVQAALLPVPSSAPAQTVVTACGQTVSGPVALGADLDCSAVFEPGVTLDDGASLDLVGFTLTNDADGTAVHCPLRCRVFSSVPGGRIAGAGIAIDGSTIPGSKITVADIEMSDGGIGLIAWSGKVADVVVTDMTSGGLHGYRKLTVRDSSVVRTDGVSGSRLRVDNSTIVDSVGRGIYSRQLKLFDTVVSGSAEEGVYARFGSNNKGDRKVTVKAVRTTISGNALDGLLVDSVAESKARVKIADSTIDGNGGSGIVDAERLSIKRTSISGNAGHGIDLNPGQPSKAKLVETTVVGNGHHGVFTVFGRMRVTSGSTVTGNGADAACGVSEACADLAGSVLPAIDTASTCDTSYVWNTGIPGSSWGICSLD